MLHKDRVAVITAGAGGFGSATALMMAREGARVVIGDIDRDSSEGVIKEIERAGSQAIFVQTDVSKKADAQNLAKAAVEKFGRLDMLINIAGIGGGGALEEMKEEDFDRVIAVHLKGTFLCSQAAIPHMKKNQWGRIVNIISRAAYKPRVGVGAYSAAKRRDSRDVASAGGRSRTLRDQRELRGAGDGRDQDGQGELLNA
jgi:3-oxoacyl-[acyl-carrier protein] reductase